MDYETFDWPYTWEEAEEDKRVYIEYMDWLASQPLAGPEDSQG
jgi:DUF971 family protein